jgi:hypothetical protein
MLKHPTIPDADKVWLMRQLGVMTDKGLRLFAVDCARRAQTYPKNYTPDPRTLAAIDVAERFAEGLATVEDLRADATAAAYTGYAAAYAAACAATYATAARAARAACAAARAARAACAAARAADDAAEGRKQVECLVAMAEKPGMFEGGQMITIKRLRSLPEWALITDQELYEMYEELPKLLAVVEAAIWQLHDNPEDTQQGLADALLALEGDE